MPPLPLLLLALTVAAGGVVILFGARLRRTSLRAAAAARRAELSERRLSETFHASPIAISLTNLDTGKFTDVNAAFIDLMGYGREELIDHSLVDLGLLRDVDHGKLTRVLKRSGVIRDRRLVARRKDGEQRELVVAMDLIVVDQTPFCLATMVDRTEQSQTTAALARTDERLRELADAMDEAFWMSNLDLSEILYISPAYERIFWLPCDALYASADAWKQAIAPIDRERLQHAFTGERFAAGAIDEFRIMRPDGEVRWIRNKSFAIRDASGKPVRLAGTFADITERRELEDQLRQTQKMESLGMLAGGVAHDFNNLLAVIASCNGMLGESIVPGSPDRELVDDIDGAVQRATLLTRQLLAFSRKQVTQPIVVDLNATVNDTHKMLRRMVGEDVLLSSSLNPDLRSVRIDPGNLVQVLMNLSINARDAMPRGGSLQIQTRNVGSEVMFSITDTGAGMPPEVSERIFEPFFTTKELGKGTGMGLAVVHGIVDGAGGRIAVESVVGVGTTFRIYLPVVDAAPRKLTAPPPICHGIEHIVIVDDDHYVRRAASRALRSHGYTVLEAHDGTSALQLLRDHAAHVDLLLTDVVMPGMDGRALAEAACAQYPGLKVLYTSGYTDDAVLRYGVKHEEVAFIEKPFRLETLAGKIRQVLDGGGSVPRLGRRDSEETRRFCG